VVKNSSISQSHTIAVQLGKYSTGTEASEVLNIIIFLLTFRCFAIILLVKISPRYLFHISMTKNAITQTKNHRSMKPDDFRNLSHQILQHWKIEEPMVDFICELGGLILDFSRCSEVELWALVGEKCNYCRVYDWRNRSSRSGAFEFSKDDDGAFILRYEDRSPYNILCFSLLNGCFSPDMPFITEHGSLWIVDSTQLIPLPANPNMKSDESAIRLSSPLQSFIIIPLYVADQKVGILHLKHENGDFFCEEHVRFYEGMAETLGVSLAYQTTRAAVHERVKELTCLYGISQLAIRSDLSLEGILTEIVNLLPPAWQYPKITQGRIVFDNSVYQTPGFVDRQWKQSADIAVNGMKRGFVQVVYTQPKPVIDEGPFLIEERKLITAIARQVAVIIERRQDQEEKARLQEQLRHADRLATIGKLAAGVAHELNEPLANILGFAQLAVKVNGVPDQVQKDLDKIINSSLFVREVIQKLLLFARQSPPRKTTLNINEVVESGLAFFRTRLEKEAVELRKNLDPHVPEIIADQAQLTQVVINLVVNAIQAMPDGGVLTVNTTFEKNHVKFSIADTGIGMSDEVRKQIFIPFFTTKDVNQGTGLGLSVVHGIVSAHRGSIDVESEVNNGSRFTVTLPIDHQ
jgi:two-component system NtrC family sensor kinase